VSHRTNLLFQVAREESGADVEHEGDEQFDAGEFKRRVEATLRGALTTPPQPRSAKPSRPKKKRGAYVRPAGTRAETGRP